MRPYIKLTGGQWKALLGRQITREGKATGFAARASMKIEPEAGAVVDRMMQEGNARTRAMGQLFRQKPGIPETEQAVTSHTFPLVEAKMRYMDNPYGPQNPHGWQPGKTSAPPVRRLRTVEPGSYEDMTRTKKGIALEDLEFHPVVSPTTRRVADVGQRVRQEGIEAAELAAREADPALTQAAGPEPLNALKQTSKAGDALPSVEELDTTLALLEQVWKSVGGGRSFAGKFWKRLAEQARGRHRQTDPLEYFIRCGMKWRENPAKFEKSHPRESKMLKRMWEHFESEVEEAAGGGA